MTISGTYIEGGFFLVSRRLLDNTLMLKPPHFLKIWIYILGRAFWKDGDAIQRGQLHTSIAELQDVGRYLIGGKLVGRLTENQVRSAYQYLEKAGAIRVTKATRGMLISIVNFEAYQNPDSYKTHTETNQTTNQGTNHTQKSPQHTDNVIKSNQTTMNKPRNITVNTERRIDEEVKKKKTSRAFPAVIRPPSGDHQTFIAWWCYAYEKTQFKPYLTTGKDFKLVKELLEAYSLKPLIIMASWFLTVTDSWLASKRGLTMFRSQANSIPGYKDPCHDAVAYRTAGIIPPVGVMFEDWSFWDQSEESQEVLAL